MEKTKTMDYLEFIESKKHSSIDYGIKAGYMAPAMFDFQKYIAEYAIKKGRCAIFLDTGLGKTIIELVIAKNYVHHTNKPVLIITPLAVAKQFVSEAEKFGIEDVEHTKDGKFTKKIVLINYERLHYVNPLMFDCVILDESSCLKNFDGAIKNQVTGFLKKVKYRFLATATPSPNDYIELGTSSEALGYMGYMDMLGKFFKNNQNNVAKLSRISKARQGEKYYLKPHAEDDFWRWVSSWSISAKKPSDLGFADERFILPGLHEIETVLRNENPLTINGQTSLFAMPAVGFKEIKQEAKATIIQRCEMAVQKCLNHDVSFCWLNLNEEGDYLESILPNSVQISGKDEIDKKEEAIEWFTGQKCICGSHYFGKKWREKNSLKTGEPYEGQKCTCGHETGVRRLISKTEIFGFGLNLQHCNHTTYFPTYSFEQYYQAIRRFWRFGQKRDVYVDIILSDGQEKIIESLLRKKENAIMMFEKLAKQTNKDYSENAKEFDKEIILPKFF